MEQTQYSKLISDIPDPDIAISMGCNVECGFGSSAYFGKVFKEKEGMTPKLYRDSIKE